MNRLLKKVKSAKLRSQRVRARVIGTTERPRLAVSISNRHVSAQVIDDSAHKTLAHATTVGQKTAGNMTSKAELIGQEIAKKAKAKKISKVVLDRHGRLYHGRVMALAEAARKSGLEF